MFIGPNASGEIEFYFGIGAPTFGAQGFARTDSAGRWRQRVAVEGS